MQLEAKTSIICSDLAKNVGNMTFGKMLRHLRHRRRLIWSNINSLPSSRSAQVFPQSLINKVHWLAYLRLMIPRPLAFWIKKQSWRCFLMKQNKALGSDEKKAQWPFFSSLKAFLFPSLMSIDRITGPLWVIWYIAMESVTCGPNFRTMPASQFVHKNDHSALGYKVKF